MKKLTKDIIGMLGLTAFFALSPSENEDKNSYNFFESEEEGFTSKPYEINSKGVPSIKILKNGRPVYYARHRSHRSHYSHRSSRRGGCNYVKEPSDFSIGHRDISLGMFGIDVDILVEKLSSLNYLDKSNVCLYMGYSKYTSIVENALKRFQIDNGLEASGIADRKTLEILFPIS